MCELDIRILSQWSRYNRPPALEGSQVWVENTVFNPPLVESTDMKHKDTLVYALFYKGPEHPWVLGVLEPILTRHRG